MNKKCKAGSLRKCAVCFVTALVLSVTAGRADVRGVLTTTTGDKRFPGMIRWQPASKVYMVTDKNRTLTFPLSKVANVRVEKPAQLESAANLVRARKYAKAIPVLEQIMKTYEMLEHDVPAARWLAEAYLKSKNAKKAVGICKEVINSRPRSALPADLVRVYWRALLAEEQYALLAKELRIAIEQGSRETAALAQITRGDMDKKKGNLKDALVDGYLRTIVLFQQVKQVQPEALYKAAKCFNELGEHSNAEKMRKKLLAEFPRDPYTEKIRSGI